MGLTVDEAAFGYNATLLSRTLHDENNRFLPFFVLSINGRDWRQPVTQYYLTAFFKLFGASVYNLRISSILVTLVTAVLLYFLTYHLLKSKALSIFAVVLFLVTPIVFIQSRLGLDNHMTVPFTIIWLLSLYKHAQAKNIKWLLLSAVSLGISFYTYKGMRAVVPVWSLASVYYLLKKTNLKSVVIFSLTIFPFFAIIPLLELKYAGAVFNNHGAKPMAYYDFLYPYLSSFDPGFLFIKGDATPYHSTGKHGMVLLLSLPLFLAGIYAALRKNFNLKFLIIVFFSAPLLMGMVDSVHRASRLMCILPAFAIFAALGLHHLTTTSSGKYKKLVLLLLILLMANFSDFYRYYFKDYGPTTQSFVGRLDYYSSYQSLKDESEQRNLKPFLPHTLTNQHGETGKFYESIYFTHQIGRIDNEENLSPGSIVLSLRQDVPGLTKILCDNNNYCLHAKY